MGKELKCGDLMPGCEAVVEGKDEAEVMARAAELRKVLTDSADYAGTRRQGSLRNQGKRNFATDLIPLQVSPGAADLALRRGCRPRIRSGRSMRLLGSPRNAGRLGRGERGV